MIKGIGLSAALGFVIVGAGSAAAQTVPDAPGKEEFLRVCSDCHSLDQPLGQRRSREGWTKLVDTMRAFGAQGSQKDFDVIIDYLTNNLGLDSKPTKPNPEAHTPGS
jgi:mono/diheme cytochrome c family protein